MLDKKITTNTTPAPVDADGSVRQGGVISQMA